MPLDQCALIDEAFRAQDQIALYRFMGHGNAAVRVYAIERCQALDMISAQLTPPTKNLTTVDDYDSRIAGLLNSDSDPETI